MMHHLRFPEAETGPTPHSRCGLWSAADCSMDGSSGPASQGRLNLFGCRLSVFPQGVCPLGLADSELPAEGGGVLGPAAWELNLLVSAFCNKPGLSRWKARAVLPVDPLLECLSAVIPPSLWLCPPVHLCPVPLFALNSLPLHVFLCVPAPFTSVSSCPRVRLSLPQPLRL